MYFHLIGIKEFQWQQHQLDALIWGGDMFFVKDFCAKYGVIIISLLGEEENSNSLGNIVLKIEFQGKEVELILKEDDLDWTAELFLEMGFPLNYINSLKNPIPENLSEKKLFSLIQKVKEKQGEELEEQEKQQLIETQKFEDKNVMKAVKIIDKNIERIEELLSLWTEILPTMDLRKLNEFLIDLKKLKLGNNFHKMAIILDQAETLIFQSENYILKELCDRDTVIDPNSKITHIDVIKEYNNVLEAEEKMVLWRQLDLKEQWYSIMKQGLIYIKFFFIDLFNSVESLAFFVDQCLLLLEYFIILAIVFFSILSFEPLLSFNSWSGIFFLPFLWSIGFFVCLYEWCRKLFSGKFMRIILFIVCSLCAFVFIELMKNSFAF